MITTEQIIPIFINILPIIILGFILIIFKDKINKYIKNINIKKNNKKGSKYEKQVAKYYELKSYLIDERGLSKGYEDGGIDFIAFGHNQILLILCKNWNPSNSYKITETKVREFYGACNFYIDDNNIRDKEVICMYVVPDKNLLNSRAINLFKKYYAKCRYEIIEYKE